MVPSSVNQTRHRRQRVIDAASVALLLAGPFLAFVHFQGYGFWHLEVLLPTIGLIVLGGLLGLALAVHPAVYAVVLGITMTVVLDWQFDIGGQVRIVLPVTIAVAYLLRAHLTTILLAVGATFYGSILLFGRQLPVESYWEGTRVPVVESLPPIIHLVLDGHIGGAGLPHAIPEADSLRGELTSFYARHGFRYFPLGYSPYFNTTDAMPNLLNSSRRSTRHSYLTERTSLMSVLDTNQYFNTLEARGYRFRVYQPDFLDYCRGVKNNLSSCDTYPVNSMRQFRDYGWPLRSRTASVVAFFLYNESYLYQRVRAVYRTRIVPAMHTRGWRLPGWEWEGQRTGPNDLVLERLLADLREAEAGTVYFAHLLDPHGPYLFDAACRSRPALTSRLGEWREGEDREITEISRTERYVQYVAQARCLLTKLEQVLAVVDSAGLGHRARFVFHGDHGSRLWMHVPIPDNVRLLTAQDYEDAFSALLAVRLPGLAPGSDPRQIGNDVLVEALLQASFSELPDDLQDDGEVFLSSFATVMVPVPFRRVGDP
jgi:hypothetical protein